MTRHAAEDIAKLPLWAQRLIEKLQADRAGAEKELLAMRTPNASRVRLVRLAGSTMAEIPLPEDAVAFYPDTAKNECIVVRVADDHVEIRASGCGAIGLLLLPKCINVTWAQIEAL